MPDRQQPEQDLPKIETPVIQSQDLEHTPGRQTRVNNSGVKIEPVTKEQRRKDEAMFAKEDEKTREAISQFEQELAERPPE